MRLIDSQIAVSYRVRFGVAICEIFLYTMEWKFVLGGYSLGWKQYKKEKDNKTDDKTGAG